VPPPGRLAARGRPGFPAGGGRGGLAGSPLSLGKLRLELADLGTQPVDFAGSAAVWPILRGQLLPLASVVLPHDHHVGRCR